MSFKSHIFDLSKIEDKHSFVSFGLFLMLMLVLGYLLLGISYSVGTTIIWLGLLGLIVNIIKNWVKKDPEGEYVSEFVLTGDKITLNEKTINTSDISNLKINIGYPKGYKHRHRYGYIVDSGTRNKIEFTFNDQELSFNFQLFSDFHLQELKKVLELLYVKGIFVSEYYFGQRTYLLKNLNYEEIQDFKKKYKLE